jgi:hypothetical protein
MGVLGSKTAQYTHISVIFPKIDDFDRLCLSKSSIFGNYPFHVKAMPTHPYYVTIL